MSPLTILLVLQLPAQGDLPARPAVEIERAAVQARQRITRASGKFRTEVRFRYGKPSALDVTRTIYLDGEKLRYRHTSTENGKPKVDIIRCFRCEDDNSYVDHLLPTDKGQRLAVRLARIGKGTFKELDLIDPRMPGMVPYAFADLRHFHLQSVLLYPDRTDPVVERLRWRGRPCYVVSFTTNEAGKPSYKAWVVPEFDFGVVRMEKTHDADGKRISSWSESEFRRWGRAELWYPAKLVSEADVDGKPYVRESTVVSDLTLNEPLPANTFRLAGLGFPDGTAVADYRSGRLNLVTIEGTELAPYVEKSRLSELPDKPTPIDPPRRRWLYAAGVGLALAALALLAYSFFRARGRPEPTA